MWVCDGEVFPIDRRLGLCLDCNKIVAIEDLPGDETMERARFIRATYTGQPLFKLLEPDHAKYLASQNGFAVLETVIGLRREPVCLGCGKSAVRPINIPEGVNSETPVSIGLGHPWCAGTLQVKHSGGMRIGLRIETREYDIHGRFVKKYFAD
mgnify:FL=1